MNIGTSFALSVCLAISCFTPVLAGQYTETFAGTAKADGTFANWNLPIAGFSVQPGALAYDGSQDKCIAVWTATPVGKTITYTANITASAAPGTDWDVAGIGIYFDDQNYWHLALVQSPESAKSDHFAELSEMYNNVWGAHSAEGTKLNITQDVAGFEWKTGATYQFKITLSPQQIQGQILEGGVVKFSQTAQFSAPAVTKGHPMLDNSGIKARYTDLHADIVP